MQVLAAVEHEPATVASIARALAHTRQGVQRIADAYAIQGTQALWAKEVAEGLEPTELDAARATLNERERRLAATVESSGAHER